MGLKSVVIAFPVILLSTPLCHGQADVKATREKVTAEYWEKSIPLIAKLRKTNDKEEVVAVGKLLVSKGDATFVVLTDEKAMDDKLKAYEVRWVDMKGQFLKDPGDRRSLLKIEEFSINVKLAGKGDKCTVSISATNGSGATVKYAKAADAAKGKFDEFPEQTTIMREIEPANYVFKSFRNGKETGKKGPVDCTDTKKAVKVEIQE